MAGSIVSATIRPETWCRKETRNPEMEELHVRPVTEKTGVLRVAWALSASNP